MSSTGMSIKVSPLIPGTSYLFRVSAITERGRGAEVGLVSQTSRPQSDAGTNLNMLIKINHSDGVRVNFGF